jgi:hypothetical protein
VRSAQAIRASAVNRNQSLNSIGAFFKTYRRIQNIVDWLNSFGKMLLVNPRLSAFISGGGSGIFPNPHKNLPSNTLFIIAPCSPQPKAP